ncbi:1855_t:CDS:2, partial [Cetraspora pellucida]
TARSSKVYSMSGVLQSGKRLRRRYIRVEHEPEKNDIDMENAQTNVQENAG